ncbi:MAG: hypothetical protein Q4C60_09510 [Eubacteriales bacterium]|nr:hypothetical protein [Eubacteriales bacterium]
MTFDNLADQAAAEGLQIKEKPLRSSDGRIFGNNIALRRGLRTSAQRACVLAEELGHYYTTVGNILDQRDTEARKQERRARAWGYEKMIGLRGIIDCYVSGCRSRAEMADHLGVTEEYLQEAIEFYREKYGEYAALDNYVICFEPHLGVVELREEI